MHKSIKIVLSVKQGNQFDAYLYRLFLFMDCIVAKREAILVMPKILYQHFYQS